jgi:hypothetical protein
MKNWVEGIVNEKDDHIKIRFEDGSKTIAIVSNSQGRIIVQFLDELFQNKEEIKAVNKELDFFLNELNKDDPWAYAIYHCSTASNIYSKVHWNYYPKGFFDS